jgi:hypothetical protein
MPLLPSDYEAPPLLRGGHLQTLYASLARRVDFEYARRERIATSDGDFLDLDWSPTGADRVVVLTHGLEGSAARGYMRGMARALHRRGWDVVAWNLRGCSGAPNRRVRTYHSGATGDLARVLDHVLATDRYDTAAMIGFSLGGNLTLKYLGERGDAVDGRIRGAAAFSTPIDLMGCAHELARRSNWHYTQYFLQSLRAKIRTKKQQWPQHVDDVPLDFLRTLTDFDDYYTAPLNGFENALDYYRHASSKPLLGGIRVPTLLVNAANDPFLAPSCYPRELAREHPHLTLEVPEHGGHVGFVSFDTDGTYWSERRAVSFLRNQAVPA